MRRRRVLRVVRARSGVVIPLLVATLLAVALVLAGVRAVAARYLAALGAMSLIAAIFAIGRLLLDVERHDQRRDREVRQLQRRLDALDEVLLEVEEAVIAQVDARLVGVRDRDADA